VLAIPCIHYTYLEQPMIRAFVANRVSCLVATITLATALAPSPASAQHGGASPSLVTTAPKESQQFAFLIGQWELEAKPQATTLAQKIHGVRKLVGTWSAWRALDGWGVVDELRITDPSGNPMLLSHAVRIYDPTAHHWKTSALDVYRTTYTQGTGEWQNGELVSTSRTFDADGKPVVNRTRFRDIKAASFRMQQDKSMDDGKTWTEGTLIIDAKRIAAVAPR
jgi:hypothetical protein